MQKFAYNPQCWSPQRVHIQSVQVRVGLQRKKMHSREEEKNIYRFSASSFSPPYGFRLPCRTVDLSCRRLQHQLNREAGAAHFKVRNRLPGPGSCIKNNCNLVPSKKKEKKKAKQVVETPQFCAVTGDEILFKGCSVYFLTFPSPSFGKLSLDHEVVATV